MNGIDAREASERARRPTNHLYRNKGDGTFEDVTVSAGLAASGWGQGACVGDYDNDGHDDLLRHLLRPESAVSTTSATDASPTSPARPGLTQRGVRWNTGCAFLDYDRDGRLDLFVANYIDLDLGHRADARIRLCAATRAFRWRAGRPA